MTAEGRHWQGFLQIGARQRPENGPCRGILGALGRAFSFFLEEKPGTTKGE
jgi:hypothetical protein